MIQTRAMMVENNPREGGAWLILIIAIEAANIVWRVFVFTETNQVENTDGLTTVLRYTQRVCPELVAARFRDLSTRVEERQEFFPCFLTVLYFMRS